MLIIIISIFDTVIHFVQFTLVVSILLVFLIYLVSLFRTLFALCCPLSNIDKLRKYLTHALLLTMKLKFWALVLKA